MQILGVRIGAQVRRKATMEADAVAALVRKQIDECGYEETPRGTTIGVPSSEEKERSYRLKLEKALVFPYLQTFTLRDTFEQMSQSPPDVTEYWVVAETEARNDEHEARQPTSPKPRALSGSDLRSDLRSDWRARLRWAA